MTASRLMPILVLGLIVAATAAQADARIVPSVPRGGGPVQVTDWYAPRPGQPWGWHPGPAHPRTAAVAPSQRMRHYREVMVVRPHGHWYAGYAFFANDADAYKWLGLTAITMAALDLMDEHQQRTLEAAQVRAATAPVGQVIVWNDAGASGDVTALREGHTPAGQYCREFQQSVTIGGKPERAFGTACQMPGGAWQVISSS